MRKPQDLFTTNYAIEYEGWVELQDFPVKEQFRNVYLWCNYLVYTWNASYYLMLKIVDKNDKLIFEGYVPNMYQFSRLKRKLKLTNCILKNTIYLGPEAIPNPIELTYVESTPITTSNICELYNEKCELNPVSIPGIILELDSNSPQNLIINGTSPVTGIYNYTLTFLGKISGKSIDVPLKITTYSPPTNAIIQENGFYILTENNNFILTQ